MKNKRLSPDQILTLHDYPVHNEHILKMYHRMFQKGHATLVPPLPVVSITNGELRMSGYSEKIKKYNALLKRFLKAHPGVEYCLIDGTHKTTAAALCSKNIRAIVFKEDADFGIARKMVESGELFSITTGGANTIDEALDVVRKHFFKSLSFETVAEKTFRMIEDNILPQYMIVENKKIMDIKKARSERKKYSSKEVKKMPGI